MTEVRAELVGNVWKVEAREGDQVGEDDVLIILESMKMEMPIEAPCAGTVASVVVKEGEPVDEGRVVATLD